MKTIVMLFFCLMSLPALAGTLRDDFEDGNWEGWTNPSGEWEVRDGVLVSKNDNDFTWLDIGKATWRNYAVTFDGKVKSHQGQYAIGGIIRWDEEKVANAYYCIALGGAGERIEASVYVDPNEFGMIRHNFSLKLDKWYNFKATVNEAQFNLFLDNELVISADWSNQPLPKSGKIELWTRWPGEYHFDNVIITGPDVPNTGPGGMDSPFIVKPRGKLTTTWGRIKKTQ